MSLPLILFAAGLLTILLPCILPLLPVVLGASIAGRSPWRPLLVVGGMLVSFVGFTFVLLIVLSQFVEVADLIRIATYEVLLLFGVGFITPHGVAHRIAAILGSLFFLGKGLLAVVIAAGAGLIAVEVGDTVATWLQQLGVDVQRRTREELGEGSPLTALIVGLTLGLVWVPCAGPALGFVFTLVRDQPGVRAAALLAAYGAGTALPLLLVGYGGQWAVRCVRCLSRYSGYVKQVAGILLVLSALALQFRLFEKLQVKLIEVTGYGGFAGRLEERIVGPEVFQLLEGGTREAPPSAPPGSTEGDQASREAEDERGGRDEEDEEETSTIPAVTLPTLPRLSRAPEISGLGPWHNSEPFTLMDKRGSVVLIDFWTYSCINCIRTLPYLKQWWEKYGSTKLTTGRPAFVILGVHSPEFVFEKSERNVADAIRRHGLTYPVAQDNDFLTWRAFANRYWPAKYLIDAEGAVRYTHFGEGAYEETELAIRSLLLEAGVDLPGSGEAGSREQGDGRAYRDQTPETYLGTRSWDALGNAQGDPTDDVVSYEAPQKLDLHSYYLRGDWQLRNEERQVLVGDSGEVRIRFIGSEINLVLGLEAGAGPVEAEVTVDGETAKAFTIDHDDLYNLFRGEYGEHELSLKLRGRGVSGYAFTFGSD